jgi:hypothetical protein
LRNNMLYRAKTSYRWRAIFSSPLAQGSDFSSLRKQEIVF